MVVRVVGIDPGEERRTVVAYRTVGRVLGNHHHIAIAVGRMHLKYLRFLCSNSRLIPALLTAVCLGIGWMRAVVKRQGDRTWRWSGCMCWKVSPRACDRSIGRRLTASRVGQVVCLLTLVQFRWHKVQHTMLAHSLAIGTGKLRSQLSNALVQLLYLWFPQDSARRLVL